MRRFKAVCELPFAPAVVHAALEDNEARITWDRNIAALEYTVLQNKPFRMVLLHSCTRHVGPISGRDFLDIAASMSFDEAATAPAGPDGFSACMGTRVSGGMGIEADDRYPPTSGIVRAFNSPGSGWVFEPVQRAGAVWCRCYYVIHTHLRGWIPTMFINSALAQSYVDFFTDLTKVLEKKQAAAEAAKC